MDKISPRIEIKEQKPAQTRETKKPSSKRHKEIKITKNSNLRKLYQG